MFVLKQNSCMFYFIKNYDNADFAPELLVSTIVSDQLKVTAYLSSVAISQTIYSHFLTDGVIKSLSGLSNIFALCKSIADKECSKKSCHIDVAINALNQYVQSTHTSNLSSDSNDKMNVSNLFQFTIEQLHLSQQATHGRRYSVDTHGRSTVHSSYTWT